ncbi:MAG: Wadjet anti-phage system protein JetD domain-containing protein [Sinimarinibacterium flocculans]|uniref:Wadjet anti-phage system protein JetD domain-containing protein n=1 Tax=Sinimarinibacterium flocculans TaxID=985250 RepID=UPI003C43A052
MSWTISSDLKAQVQRFWDNGALPSELVVPSGLFPRRLTLKGPTSADLTNRFDDVRKWVADIRQVPHGRIVMRELRHRVIGSNAIPSEVWVDSVDSALDWIGKREEARRIRAAADLSREREPTLITWVSKHASDVLRIGDDWSKLLDVVNWLRRHPHPGIYLRQVDLPGVHTKFIENYRGVLTSLLDISLPEAATNTDATGIANFSRRFGFLEKPARVRFRVLDQGLRLIPTGGDQDLTINSETFAALELPIRRVFVTENETNYLAFPGIAQSIVLFGAGYGFAMIKGVDWLKQCEIHYWGDIDTHGFAILDQLRASHDHVASLLMDRQTLMNHQALWGIEDSQELRDLTRLTAEESSLFNDLRDNRLGLRVRLEQERIGFGLLMAALAKIQADNP